MNYTGMAKQVVSDLTFILHIEDKLLNRAVGEVKFELGFPNSQHCEFPNS